MSEPHRVGAKPPPRAIADGGCLSSGARELSNRPLTGPLTRDNSALRSSDCPAHAGVLEETTADRRRRPRRLRKADGRGGGHGIRRSDGRACGSFRWQKSTNGAWPRAPAGEEPAVAARSSPLPSGASRRRSVGSPATGGKTGGGWRVRVRGAARKRRAERTFVDGRRPEVARCGTFDEVRREAVSGGGCALRRTSLAVRASERGVLTRRAEDNAARTRGRRPRGLDRFPPRNGRRPQSRSALAKASGQPRPKRRAAASRSSVERRQTPPDPSSPPGFTSTERARRASGRTPRASHDPGCRCTCRRVGCRSR